MEGHWSIMAGPHPAAIWIDRKGRFHQGREATQQFRVLRVTPSQRGYEVLLKIGDICHAGQSNCPSEPEFAGFTVPESDVRAGFLTGFWWVQCETEAGVVGYPGSDASKYCGAWQLVREDPYPAR
jgi:hypothetical protein